MKNKIKTFLFIGVFMFHWTILVCQELVLNTNFAVRDFTIQGNTMLYIEKRDIKSFDLKTLKNDSSFIDESFFIGGYGLRVFFLEEQNKIVTASNELIMDRSSIRFYDIATKSINKYEVLYRTEVMDFFIEPKDSLFFLSKKDFTIDCYRYGGKPRYIKTDSIQLDSFSRKIIYVQNKLYYITDSGKLFEYNFLTKKRKLLFHDKRLLINFVFDNNHKHIFMSSFDGAIIKLNINSLSSKEYSSGKHTIEAIDIFNDKYIIAGDWSGSIKILDLLTLKLVKEYKNKYRIIKLLVKDDYFYTSSSDRSIKKWKIK